MNTKTIISTLALFTFFSPSVFSSECSARNGFYKTLDSYTGRYELGNCVVEFHLCEKTHKAPQLPYYLEETILDNSQNWLGDMLIKNKKGTSLYVPFYSTEKSIPRTTTWASENRNTVQYNYKDKNTDPISGFKENVEVVFYKNIKRIEIRMKNSVESRKNPIRSLFFPNIKMICAE
jgi:hypothetical protein